MDCVDRIFDLVDKKYREQREFAYELGLEPTMISSWRRRRSSSYNRRLPQIATVLETTVSYLLNGTDGEEDIPKEPEQPYLVSRYNRLSKAAQQEVMAFIEFKAMQETKAVEGSIPMEELGDTRPAGAKELEAHRKKKENS